MSGYVITNKAMNGTRAIVYASSRAGLLAIQDPREDLDSIRDVTRDPASMNHFLALNRVFLGLLKEFKVNYWITDFQIRTDNMHYGKAGLAKDYDAVGEILIQGSPLRIGIEYEASLKSTARYRELTSCYASEKYLHLIIYILPGPALLKSLAPNFKALGEKICFINEGDFHVCGARATAYFWNGGESRAVPLIQLMSALGKAPRPMYVPFSQLHAANLPAF